MLLLPGGVHQARDDGGESVSSSQVSFAWKHAIRRLPQGEEEEEEARLHHVTARKPDIEANAVSAMSKRNFSFKKLL